MTFKLYASIIKQCGTLKHIKTNPPPLAHMSNGPLLALNPELFRHIIIYTSCVLEWNKRAHTNIFGCVRKFLEFAVSRVT